MKKVKIIVTNIDNYYYLEFIKNNDEQYYFKMLNNKNDLDMYLKFIRLLYDTLDINLMVYFYNNDKYNILYDESDYKANYFNINTNEC